MYKLTSIPCAIALALMADNVQALDPTECLDCHDIEEYRDLDAEDLLAELVDPAIRRHAPYADITMEQVEEILEAAQSAD